MVVDMFDRVHRGFHQPNSHTANTAAEREQRASLQCVVRGKEFRVAESTASLWKLDGATYPFGVYWMSEEDVEQ